MKVHISLLILNLNRQTFHHHSGLQHTLTNKSKETAQRMNNVNKTKVNRYGIHVKPFSKTLLTT